MNAWITRLLGGAACTVGVLALGMGVAQADVTHVRTDAAATAKSAAGSHAAHLSGHSTLAAKVGKASSGRSVKASVTANANPTRHRALTTRVGLGSRSAHASVTRDKGVQSRAAIGSRRTSSATASGSATRSTKAATVKAVVKTDPARHIRPWVVPSVIGDVHATASDVPAAVCVRVDAGDCSSSGGSGDSDQSTALADLVPTEVADLVPTEVADTTPMVVADTSATAADLADADSCLRINAGDCGSGSGSSGNGSDPTVADLMPAVVADSTATAADLATADSCLRINAGDCSGSGSGTGSEPTALGGLVGSVLADLSATAGDAAAQGTGTGGVLGGDGSGGATGGETGIGGSVTGFATDGGIGGSAGSRAGVLAASLFVVPLGGPGSGALASTGVSARMVGVLVAGLLSLLMALPMLRRRRSG
jgi:hypothetical protein